MAETPMSVQALEQALEIVERNSGVHVDYQICLRYPQAKEILRVLCRCTVVGETRDPAEPHIPAQPEWEQADDCPVHPR